MIKNIIKSVFNALGLRVVRQTDQPQVISNFNGDNKFIGSSRTSMIEALEYLKYLKFEPKLIVDIGAANGTTPLLEVFPSSKHLLIEPLVEFEPQLLELQKKYDLEFLICAVGMNTDEITINVHNDLYGSSILKEQDGSIADGTPRKVQVMRLDQIIKHFKIEAADGIIVKIDVQGAELDVLKSGEQLLKIADVVIIECSFFSFQFNAAEVTDVVIFMKKQGFVMFDMYDFHNRPFDNALGQVDISFVKETGIFRKNHNWATSKQRNEQLQIKG